MRHPFAKWNRGEHVYSETEKALMGLKEGIKIGNILNNCTICPVHNGTCNDYFTITTVGFHPDKGIKEHKIMICPLGVQDIDHCPLSK